MKLVVETRSSADRKYPNLHTEIATVGSYSVRYSISGDAFYLFKDGKWVETMPTLKLFERWVNRYEKEENAN